jgi:Sec7-like guanine-nucleotide exchange factor
MPDDVAKFLHNTDGLSKAMIGEYLGDGCVLATISYLYADVR